MTMTAQDRSAARGAERRLVSPQVDPRRRRAVKGHPAAHVNRRAAIFSLTGPSSRLRAIDT